MRKIIGCGILGAMVCAAVLCRNRHSEPGIPQEQEPRTLSAVRATDQPCPLDAFLPDPAKLIEDWQAFDLLNSRKDPTLAMQDDGFTPEDSLLRSSAPQSIRSPDEAGCFPVMPHSEWSTPLVMLGTEASLEDDEEQEVELEIPVDPKITEERLKRVLQSYLDEGKLNGKPAVDTMEFRPSDAKKGEFDRIPF
jgi:hypothetical protein